MNGKLGYYLMPHPPIMIPEVGKGEEVKIQNTIDACNKIGQEIKELAPETIIIITSHGPVFNDAIAISNEKNIYGDLGKFNVFNVNMKKEIDTSLTTEILNLTKNKGIQTVGVTEKLLRHFNRSFELDHGSIVPLYHIDKYYQDYKIVHITYGMLSFIELYQFGIILKEAINNLKRNCVIIASGDLSHRLLENGPYPYSPKGKIFDELILSYLEKGKTYEIFSMNKKDIEEAGECGYRSILILLGVLGEFKGKVLSYEGPFGVGYGVMSFKSMKDENILNFLHKARAKRLHEKINKSDYYVKLARKSIEYYLKNKKLMKPPRNLPEDMITKRHGVFVSLKKFGDLRGCIGTFLPTTQSVAQEIINNAVEAAFRDPRFAPLEEKELIDLDISVDILSEPIKSNIEDLDPKIYGIIVSQGRKRGLLLPNLSGVNTVDEQINIACQKAGINPETHFDLERFTVERHIEGEARE